MKKRIKRTFAISIFIHLRINKSLMLIVCYILSVRITFMRTLLDERFCRRGAERPLNDCFLKSFHWILYKTLGDVARAIDRSPTAAETLVASGNRYGRTARSCRTSDFQAVWTLMLHTQLKQYNQISEKLVLNCGDQQLATAKTRSDGRLDSY